MLGEDPQLVAFMDEVARRNRGRLFTSDADTLGEYVVQDYLRARAAASKPRSRSARRGA
jgi:uncharacterized protein with von Willebrand factor type A (vWA) domain